MEQIVEGFVVFPLGHKYSSKGIVVYGARWRDLKKKNYLSATLNT